MHRYSSSANKTNNYGRKLTGILSRATTKPFDQSNRTMLGQSMHYEPVSHRRNQLGIKRTLNQSKINQSRVYQLTELVQSIRINVQQTKLTSKQQFLKGLYQKKAEDLKAIKNPKHQINFIQRMKQKLTDEMLVAAQCQLGINSCKYITEYLPKTSILKLVLNNNPIGDEGVKLLSGSFPQLQLIHLQLISINIGPKGTKVLLQNLCKCSSLQWVNLSSFEGLYRNKFNKDSVPQLQLLFANPQCQISYFAVQNSSIGDEGFMYICKGVNQRSKLKTLNVSGNQIKDLKWLLQRFRPVPLSKLYLKNNNIGDAGMEILATILGTEHNRNTIAKSLKVLDVSNNKIRSFGLQAFSRQMNNNQALQQVTLDFNPLYQGQRFFNFKYLLTRNWTIKKLSLRSTIYSLDDFRSLKEGIQAGKSIHCLNLSNNSLENQSFQMIVQMLAQNRSIKTILLQNCNISDSYLNKIDILKKNKSLNEINFQNNFIHDKGAYMLVELLKKCNKITSINIRKNCIGPNVMREIQHLLKQNRAALEGQIDFSYFEYVDEIHSSQRSLLLTNIQKLKKKQQKEKLHKIICQIADKDKEINIIKASINEEKRKIANLQNISALREPFKSQNQSKDEEIFCTQEVQQN